MDGGKTFHGVVPIVFGKNPAFVSVGAHGDRVAVAFEDPNSAAPAIGISFSQDYGHTFAESQIISGQGELARQPKVELESANVRVWWSDHAPDPRISATRTAYREATFTTGHRR
jgi:hypothetical protein